MFYPATKVSLIAERLFLEKRVKTLEAAGAKEWTIIDGGGKGKHFTRASDSAWTTSVFSIIRVEAIITSQENARAIACEIEGIF